MSDKKYFSERKKDIIVGRVKELREQEQLTQLEFAESIDVSSNTISRIERKEMSLSSDIALKIAGVYNVSLDWLFFCGDEQLSPKRKASIEEAFECMNEQECMYEQKLDIEEKPKLKLNNSKILPNTEK